MSVVFEKGVPFILAIGASGTGDLRGSEPAAFAGDEEALSELKKNQHLFLVYMQIS